MASHASLDDLRNHYDGMHITLQNSFRIELVEVYENIFDDYYGEIEGFIGLAHNNPLKFKNYDTHTKKIEYVETKKWRKVNA